MQFSYFPRERLSLSQVLLNMGLEEGETKEKVCEWNVLEKECSSSRISRRCNSYTSVLDIQSTVVPVYYCTTLATHLFQLF